jgi:hypothetical protein
MAEQLTAQQRATLFAQATRQNLQMLPQVNVPQENTTVSFTLPKARLLSRVFLNVEAVANGKSTAANISKDPFSPYKILRRVSVDLNNGFMPFQVSGRDLAIYNMARLNPQTLFNQNTTTRGMNYVENGANNTTGVDNKIQFTIPLSVVLNDRDPVGLVLLQNDTTNVTVTIDVDTLAKAYVINGGNSDVVTFKSMVITPMVETFTVPTIPQAIPDLSVLKLVSAKNDTFAGGSEYTMKLNVGTIYRKILVYLEDNNGVPLTESQLTGNFQLIFNQADVPYQIKPTLLAHYNNMRLGTTLPAGVFLLDFSDQGLPNYGGSRDYIDTENLTEFWLRFTPTVAGKVTVISENISRLKA